MLKYKEKAVVMLKYMVWMSLVALFVVGMLMIIQGWWFGAVLMALSVITAIRRRHEWKRS